MRRRGHVWKRIGATALSLIVLASGLAVSGTADCVYADDTEVVEAEMPLYTAGTTPVSQHGRLHVEGTNIKDEYGNVVQLRGVSTHGINWDVGRPYVNQETFRTLRDDWGANTIRLAMYTSEYNGYCTGGNQAELKGLLDNGVQYATNLGMYAIIDWHILNDGNPLTYVEQAKQFWGEISAKYRNSNNVLYEICNEPNGCSWDDIKNYANQVIPIIRANDPNAIIIVGTPTWSQLGMQGHTNEVADSPLTGYSNLVYALHFYCSEWSHSQYLPAKVDYAISRGVPVFVSEFGLSEANGNGNVDTAQAESWLKKLDSYNISYNVWSLNNKNESSALIQSYVTKTSGWSEGELTRAGQWIRNQYRSRNVDATQVQAFVTRLYDKCLGRQPDEAGLQDWSNRLINGSMSGTRVAYGFVFSPEYKSRNTTDDVYVEMLYRVFLDRASDPSGKTNWLNALKQGASREYVFRGFAESQEFTQICASYGIDRGTYSLSQPRDQNIEVTAFVARLYQQALGRQYDEDGLNNWCGQIVSGQMNAETVAECFIYSAEFENKNLSNTEYVNVLYRTFLGREADSAGQADWVGQLNRGASRRDVLHGFSRSQEFSKIMAQYGL